MMGIIRKQGLIFLAFLFSFSGSIAGTTGGIHKKNDFYKVVAQDGTGDYTSVQAAINDSKSFPYQRITIFIKNGKYHEKVKIPEWNPYISLIGESKDGTVISYDDYFNKINSGANSTFMTYTLLAEGDDCIIRNLTIENTSGEVGQAVALSVHANNVAVINCIIRGNQDTLYATGNGFKNYFKDCFIQGTTDFIFGSATAWFDNCTIHSLKNSYITAASTPRGEAYGFVFSNCHLTAEKNVTQVYLGRPWRIYAQTVFIRCTMDGHIRPEGWYNWSKPEAEQNSFYAEYNCAGPGYAPASRVGWSHQLTEAQAEKYTPENCMGAAFSKTIQELTASLK